jgi:hypothetical protein
MVGIAGNDLTSQIGSLLQSVSSQFQGLRPPPPPGVQGPSPFGFGAGGDTAGLSGPARGALGQANLLDGLLRAGDAFGALTGGAGRSDFDREGFGALSDLLGELGGGVAVAGSESRILAFEGVSLSFDSETQELSISIERASLSSSTSFAALGAPGVQAEAVYRSATAERSSLDITIDLDDRTFEAEFSLQRLEIEQTAIAVAVGPGVTLPPGLFPPPGEASEEGILPPPTEEQLDALALVRQARELSETRFEIVLDLFVAVGGAEAVEEEDEPTPLEAALDGADYGDDDDQPTDLTV